MKDEYVFFWRGPFSQWYRSPMRIMGGDYNCCEQWMMVNKAMTFDDADAVRAIMATNSPKEQKEIGRRVKGYDDAIWMDKAYDIVVQGNRCKFSQNANLYDILMSTGDKIIVEASPYDTRWGIGLAEDDPGIKDPFNWKGENLLGEAIMQVRQGFIDEKIF